MLGYLKEFICQICLRHTSHFTRSASARAVTSRATGTGTSGVWARTRSRGPRGSSPASAPPPPGIPEGTAGTTTTTGGREDRGIKVSEEGSGLRDFNS